MKCSHRWPLPTKLIRPDFDEEAHRYTFNGKPLRSVSETLSSLDIFRYDDNNAAIEYARDRGTAVHKATEYWDLGYLDESSLDPEIVPRLGAWKSFVEEKNWVSAHVELKTWSMTGYAGTIDRVGHFCNPEEEEIRDVWVIDLKTSQQASRWWKLQLAAYCMAYAEQTETGGESINLRRGSIQLFGDGTYAFKPYTDPTDYLDWQAANRIEAWKRRYSRKW